MKSSEQKEIEKKPLSLLCHAFYRIEFLVERWVAVVVPVWEPTAIITAIADTWSGLKTYLLGDFQGSRCVRARITGTGLSTWA